MPGGGPPPLHTRMSIAAERVARVAARSLPRPPRSRRRPPAAPRVDRSPPPRPRSAPATGCRSRPCTPSSASARARCRSRARSTRPRPRRGGPRCRSSRLLVDRPARVAQRLRRPPGAGADDLGADRHRGLLRRAGTDVEADRRVDAGRAPSSVTPASRSRSVRLACVRAGSHRAEVADVGARASRRSRARRTCCRG